MKISVVIPTHNRATVLPRALSSVYQQSHQPYEVIVVDDGSTDDSEAIITEKFPQCKTILQPQKGVSSARNCGIRAATGDWIALLDSDDEWLPNKLEKQIQALEKSPNSRFCHTEEIWIRNGKRVNPMYKHSKSGGMIYLNCLPLCVISPSSVLIHRSIFEKYGYFDESLPACEDYDLWLRVCAHENVTFINDAQITKYGGHEDQLSRQHWGMDRFRIQALENSLKDPDLKMEYRIEAINMVIKKSNILAMGARKREADKRGEYYEFKQQYYQAILESL